MAQEAGEAIYDALVAASVNGGNRIYQNIAATGAADPYIVIRMIGGADTMLDACAIRDELWAVHAFSTASAATVKTLSEGIMDALHKENITIPGSRWGLLAIHTNEQVVDQIIENDERTFLMGGIFRVRLFQKFS